MLAALTPRLICRSPGQRLASSIACVMSPRATPWTAIAGRDVDAPQKGLVGQLAFRLRWSPTIPASSPSTNAPKIARPGPGARRSETSAIVTVRSSSKLEANEEEVPESFQPQGVEHFSVFGPELANQHVGFSWDAAAGA